jgi:putative ABC transport system permease protein
MKLRTIVWREVFERRNQLATSFFAILLGITAIVAIRNVTYYSEKAVARELDALGANILVLPKSCSLQDYYAADMQGEEFPEEYVTTLAASGLEGLDNISPKFSMPLTLGDKHFTLTGILPKSEFQAKAAWQGAGIFSRPQGCGVVELPGQEAPPPKETLVRKRVIDNLGETDALLGADVAASLGLKQGDALDVLGKSFTVTAVLPQTGTVDDSRVFAHLHTVQTLAGKGPVLNAIEIVGCCLQISKGLVGQINKLLPEAKVVTVTQIVETQVKTNHLMSNLSLVFLGIIALVGGASIANYMYANVFERKREIGTLMAMGAGSRVVLKMFMLKAALLGLAGGIAGYVLGTIAAVVLGPQIAGVPVLPMFGLAPLAIGVAMAIALVASYFPARRAARMDPCAALQET